MTPGPPRGEGLIASVMRRLDARLWRRRRLVVAAWLILVVAAVPFAARQSDNLTSGGFENSSSESLRVQRAIEGGDFPGAQSASLAIVLAPRAGARPEDMRRAIARVEDKVAAVPDLRLDPAGRRTARVVAAQPGRPVILPLRFGGGQRRSIDHARDLREELELSGSEPQNAVGGPVNVHVAGQGGLWAAFQEVAAEDIAQAETRGFPVIALVLLAAFGSLAAAALPLGLGAATVVIAGACIWALSQATEMSVFVSSIASMIGIGVAVDYSLFILVRYREELRAGSDPDQARAAALATSGRAVALAGLTVITSLCALFLIPSTGIRSMAVGAILVVAISVLAASTLLPVLIGMLGRRAYEPGRLGRFIAARRSPPESRRWSWVRWTNAVMRRPVVSLLAATLLLLAVGAPALGLEVRNGATSQLDSDHEARQGIDAIARAQGPGALGPTHVVVRFREPIARGSTAHGELTRVAAAIERDPGVGRIVSRRPSEDGRAQLLTVVLRTNPESQSARDTLDRLRDDLPGAAGGGSVEVGGTTALLADFDRLVADSLWVLILVVLALSFVVLLILLRSIVLPLKAIVMNVLSVAAAYGVLVAVYQWGWLEFIGVDKAPSIYPTTLPLVLVIAFGLSMDYHVFLLSRIRERYEATGDTRQAVAEALATSAGPITSAALIMVAVFIAFVSAGAPSVQQIGLATAVAIAVDATIVRLVIVPTAMELLGKWNWWLPQGLERVLPASTTQH